MKQMATLCFFREKGNNFKKPRDSSPTKKFSNDKSKD